MKILLRIVVILVGLAAVVEFFRAGSLALGTNSNPHASNSALGTAGILILTGLLLLVTSLFVPDELPTWNYARSTRSSHHYRDSSEEYRDYRGQESTGYDPYYILDLSKGATDNEVKTRFRDLSRKYHPDVSGIKGTDHLFNEVQKAYKTICKERGL